MPTLSEYLTLTNLYKKDIKIVYANIEEEVNNDITLDDLDNVSKTSKEGLMLYIPAYFTWFFENYILKVFKSDVQTLIDANTSQTDEWWSTNMKQFQDGDTLLFDTTTKKYYYATLDVTKQIITYCSVTSIGGLCTVKVAKADRTPLSSPELSRAAAYGDRVQPSGANIEYVSVASDKLKCPTVVYYNPLKDSSAVQTAVEAAINAYLQVLNSKGEFNINKFEDSIQSIIDVTRVKRGTIEAKANGGAYVTITDIVYETYSGFIEVDAAFPLSTVITYLPDNG